MFCYTSIDKCKKKYQSTMIVLIWIVTNKRILDQIIWLLQMFAESYNNIHTHGSIGGRCPNNTYTNNNTSSSTNELSSLYPGRYYDRRRSKGESSNNSNNNYYIHRVVGIILHPSMGMEDMVVIHPMVAFVSVFCLV